MSLVLRCDAPGCTRETATSLRTAGLALPPGWWAFPAVHETTAACCNEHLAIVIAARQPSGDQPQPRSETQ